MVAQALKNKQRSGQYQGHTEAITDPARIAGILYRIRDSHLLISIAFPNSRQLYNSAILEIDPNSKYIEIDELNPEQGHKKLLNIQTLTANTKLDGVNISFKCQLIEIGHESDIAFYRMTFPEKLLYRQQRAHYRVQISAALDIPISIRRDDGTVLNGKVRDISAGGVGMRFTINASDELLQGEYIPKCIVNLADNKIIKSAIEVRFHHKLPDKRICLVGARFVGMSNHERDEIIKFVTIIDRESRQKLPEN